MIIQSKKMKKLLLLVLVFPLFTQSLFSQKAPASYGKIDAEDLKMTVYEKDTSAVAVVLIDYGWFNVNDFSFTRLYRVKILKKAGYSYADFKDETMSKPAVRGVVYSLDGDKVVKEKLPSSSIFIKKTTSHMYETSLAMPNIKEGSVFDIELRYDFLPSKWYFQNNIPVVHSELCINESPYIKFTKNFFGYIPLALSTTNRWIAKDVPAFKSELYMDSYQNYISKIEFELSAITAPNYNEVFATSWEAVNETILSSTDFPDDSPLPLNLMSTIDELKKSGKQGDELIKSAFEASKRIHFNGDNSLYISEEGLAYKIKSGSGNAADVNFTLYQILKKLDFHVIPVGISTRSHGIISQFNPSLKKLNYMLVAIPKENGFMLLDATEKYMPYTMLPDRCINGSGRILSQKYSQWIPLVSKEKEIAEYKYDLTLNEDMSLTGTIKTILSGYAAYDFRSSYANYNSSDEFARDAEKNNPGLVISDITIEDVEDIYKPVTITFQATIEGMVSRIDNELYITPLLFEQVKENPFNTAERIYPISYSRLEDTKVNVRIKLPDNFKAGVLPLALTKKMRNNAVSFSYSVSSVENLIETDYSFNTNSLSISQDQYKEIRGLYTNIVSKQAEPLILKIQ